MEREWNRRDFVRLMSIGGVVIASGLSGCASPGANAGAASETTPTAGRTRKGKDFFFLQLSDTHWGFSGPPNPEANVTLKKTVETINASPHQPDFIVFTGDLTHMTRDPKERRARMAEFKSIVAGLNVKTLYFIPGEHDASADGGEAYREMFGPSHYAFDHEGVHFVALDNVSDPNGALGDVQIAWLESDLASIAVDTPIVVLAHRPLFPLFPAWDWDTDDGDKALAILAKRPHVTVFYGHIHQEHHHMTGHIAHHSARSLVFALPAPGSVPEKAPVPWDPAAPFRGIGYRGIETKVPEGYALAEMPVTRS